MQQNPFCAILRPFDILIELLVTTRFRLITKFLLITSGLWFAHLAHADDTLTKTLSDSEQLAKALGWVPNDAKSSVCRGSYQEPILGPADTVIALDQAPIDITANQTDFHNEGISTLLGNVIINQPNRWTNADRVELNRDSDGDITTADLYGNVVLREPGKLVVSDHGQIQLQDNAGSLYNAWYRLLLSQKGSNKLALTQIDDKQNRLNGLTARGHADQVEQQKPQYIILHDTTYTTCAPTQGVWHLQSKEVDLDQDAGRGTAYNTTLYVGPVPIFYTPYFNFPIDKRRQSGFLAPTYGSSSLGGLQLGVPYYWNIAPNYDAMFTPTFYTLRGALLEGQFRYLTPITNGTLSVGFIPGDQGFRHFQESALIEYGTNPALSRLEHSSSDRSYINWANNFSWGPRWSSTINYSKVSDDYYLEDFNAVKPQTANQLLQQGTLKYTGDNWTFLTNVQQYQTLHPVNQIAVTNQYAMLPEINLSGSWLEDNGITWLWNSDAVNFERSDNPGEVYPSESGEPTSGQRYNFMPGISYNYSKPWGYVKPAAQWEFTQYNLSNQLINAGMSYPNNISRSLPIFSIDSGLYFERGFSFYHSDYTETLEPRIFYLYIPYRSQYQIPLFDTGIQPFSFDQLFRTNRFTGIDRIGDANQVSLALTTRFLDANTGEERWSMGIGRIFYAEDRRVMLCNTPDCVDPSYTIGATSPTETASPIASFLKYHIDNAWSVNADLAWDPKTSSTNNGSFFFQYMPITNKIINVGYNYVQYGDVLPGTNPTDPKNNLNQASVSFAWPIQQNWQLLGNVNYNLSHQHGQTFFYGLQYDNCCWSVRFLTGRSYVGLNGNNNPTYNKQIFLQFEFKGLGTAGSVNGGSTLMTLIPGYTDTLNQQSNLRVI